MPSGLPAVEELPDKQLAEEPEAGSRAEHAVRMDAILSTALEVANGMSYLHARSIVHGDLTGSNVLLQECLVRPFAWRRACPKLWDRYPETLGDYSLPCFCYVICSARGSAAQ